MQQQLYLQQMNGLAPPPPPGLSGPVSPLGNSHIGINGMSGGAVGDSREEFPALSGGIGDKDRVSLDFPYDQVCGEGGLTGNADVKLSETLTKFKSSAVPASYTERKPSTFIFNSLKSYTVINEFWERSIDIDEWSTVNNRFMASAVAFNETK